MDIKELRELCEIAKLPWHIDYCNNGENCWCRLIVTNLNPPKDEDWHEHTIVPDGSISKKRAEQIIKIANALPKALDEIERMRKENKRISKEG